MSAIPFDRRLYKKYDVAGPRYTSYPTAPHFHTGFSESAYRQVAAGSNEDPIPRPLSLYAHIPFCHSLCYYCACSKIVSRHTAKAEIYLHYLERELALQGPLFDRDRPLRQLHLGGGTPTYLDDRQLWRLMQAVGRRFTLAEPEDREFSVEVDPRAVGDETIAVLAELGFNRISIGVQDFDPEVQKAVNRLQSLEQTVQVIEDARRTGYQSVSLDLIYGLPKQTLGRFAATLDQVIELKPERLSIYNYAHLPERVKAQRMIVTEDLPSPEEKMEILAYTVDHLTRAGYRYIGMDHFALPDSDLARSLDNGTLQRNFQGYSTHADCDLVGIGMTAIGKIGDSYSQNLRDLKAYYQALDAGRLPVARGYLLNADDRLRREVIEQIMCRAWLDFAAIEHAYDIRFSEYFRSELDALQDMENDGLLKRREDGLEILPAGRLLLRNIAMVFDRYLWAGEQTVRYSRTV